MSIIAPAVIPVVYNGSVNATKVEVTDNAQSLIYTISILNATSAEAYLQIFDADATNVTVGTTTPTIVLGVGAEGNPHFDFSNHPILLTTGFTIASTTARAGSSNAVQEVTITYSTKA